MRARIVGVGSALPEARSPTTALEAELDLPPGWIAERTGLEHRPVAAPEEATSDLATRAAAAALAQANVATESIALLLLATSTPDYPLPPTAPAVAHRLGLTRAGACDLAGACAGFLYALALADAFVRVERRPVLVIGANVLTRRVNPNDRATVALFSDGAGAVLLAPSEGEQGILAWDLAADGSEAEALYIPAGGSRKPLDAGALERGEQWMRMTQGDRLFRRAVEEMSARGKGALSRAGLSPLDIDWWIPHQANRRILLAAGRRLGIAQERTVDVMAQFGNSSAATIPLALTHAANQGWLAPGQRVLLTAVGAGLLSAGAVLTW